MSIKTLDKIQIKSEIELKKSLSNRQFVFSPAVIEAYYQSGAFELVCALDAALENFNENRRKALPDELDFRPKGFFSDGVIEAIEMAFWKMHDELNELYESASARPEFSESLGRLIQLNIKQSISL
jgi:hypothetical protein